MTETEIIEGCKREDKLAQRLLYERYSPLLYSVCKRYVGNKEEAEDALLSGFYKIMTQIGGYQGNGSFEGWCRRVVVNESLMLLRKKKQLTFSLDDKHHDIVDDEPSIESNLSAAEILLRMEKLSPGYRTIFYLYVVEGYQHHEIAEQLGISINTSKSQLIMAKKRLKELLNT